MPQDVDVLHRNYRLSGDVFTTEFGEETVMLQVSEGVYYGIDEIGTRVLTGLRDGTSPIVICREIAKDFDVEQSQVETDVREFLKDLLKNAIVEPEPEAARE